MAEFKPDECIVCLKPAQSRAEKFQPFIFAVFRGEARNPETGRYEPIVRDGIFDQNGKLALLKACPTCAPKVLRVLDKQDPAELPRGQFRTLVEEIAARRRLEGLRLH